MAINTATALDIQAYAPRQEFGFIADTLAELTAADRTPYAGSIVYVIDNSTYYAILEDSLEMFQVGLKGRSGTNPQGNTNEVQFVNASGSFQGASNVEIDNGELCLEVNSSPLPPSPNRIKLQNRNIGGRNMLGMLGPSGLSATMAIHPIRNPSAVWSALGSANAISATGGAALTITGTVGQPAVSATNLYNSLRRVQTRVTVAAVNAIAGWRGAAQLWHRGSGPKRGGFHMIIRWGNDTGAATTTNRCFVGMQASVAVPTDVEPSTQTNIIGCGWDAADANIQIMHNDGAVTATKIDLGATLPVPIVDSSKVYELSLFCAPNSSQVTWEFTDLDTDATTNGTITTDLPLNTTFLAPRMWMSVGGTSSVIGMVFHGMSIETDY